MATTVATLRLPLSNAFLLLGQRPVLVDAGGPRDLPRLEAALERAGVRPPDVALLILTHGHADHAGGASGFRERWGTPIAVFGEDTPLLRAGRNGPLASIGLEARLLRRLTNFPFPPYVPDVELDAPLNLARYGVAGVVRPLPGHTRGSAAVVLEGGDIVAGDVLRGGLLGGALWPGRPAIGYYQENLEQTRVAIGHLLALPAGRFLVGHGGPLRRPDVVRWLARPAIGGDG